MPVISELTHNSCSIKNISNLNVIVGRNGSGKSRFFRAIAGIKDNPQYFVSYISPERAGSFLLDAHTEHNRKIDKGWEDRTRLQNQAEGFKKISALKLRELAMLFWSKLDQDPKLRAEYEKTFASEKLAKINGMLSNVSLELHEGLEFRFVTNNDEIITAESISSGESEVVSLSVEILYFFEKCSEDKFNVLFLDEPDVHLHPDLQARLARFMIDQLNSQADTVKAKTFIFLATHSTPLLTELALSNLCSIGTKYSDSLTVEQTPISNKFINLAPFFGHPLSRFINNEVPFIIEGEDDERVWSQAYRTSFGRLKIFPCLSQSVNHQLDLEKSCEKILSSIYEDPKAISLRDADGNLTRTDLDPIGCVKRFRLRCYAIENLLLTNEVLDAVGKNWTTFIQDANTWLANHPDHQYANEVNKFLANPDRGRDIRIKDIRHIVVEILGSKKQWEVIVGKEIGKLDHPKNSQIIPHSIVDYLGLPFLQEIGLAEK